jgi:hypothetical protein
LFTWLSFGSALPVKVAQFSVGANTPQKTNKINNLLTKWRRADLIQNLGSDKGSRWVLAEKTAEKK